MASQSSELDESKCNRRFSMWRVWIPRSRAHPAQRQGRLVGSVQGPTIRIRRIEHRRLQRVSSKSEMCESDFRVTPFGVRAYLSDPPPGLLRMPWTCGVEHALNLDTTPRWDREVASKGSTIAHVRWHPDRRQNHDCADEAKEKFQEVRAAFEYLQDCIR